MNVNFITTTNQFNGYGMTREYFKKYLPANGVNLDPPNSGNKIDLVLHIPPTMQFSKAPIKVLYTMLEGDTVPDSWYRFLEMADHILVPSKFVQNTFKNAGFKSTVIPLGYDPDLFINVGPRHNPVYTFLHYEAFQDRKGWRDVLDAWSLSGLAEEETDCQLVLKTIRSYKYVYEKLHNQEMDMCIPHNVKIITGEMPHHSIFDLLSTSDCFVFPSHGEGFSLPPIEAMATGLPVILSKGHSHMDYYNEDYMYGVDADIKIPARYENWENQGNFVRCNINSLANTMLYVFKNKDEAVKKGLRSIEYVKEYSYINTAVTLENFLCQL